MAYEQKDMTGSLFRETDKRSERAPDYRGRLMVEGREWRLSGWIKIKQDGSKWLSLSVEEPQQKQPQKQAPADMGDEIPF